jgi:hypothetical protein
MTTHVDKELAADTGTAGTPSEGQATGLHPAQVVRKLAALPVSLNDWLSGPPMTDLERTRAVLAEITNSQAHRTIVF